MSPKNIKKLKELRKSLDKLDNLFINLIKKRINFILNKIRKKSKKMNIDPKITNKIWKNMIWSFIDYERRNFKKK